MYINAEGTREVCDEECGFDRHLTCPFCIHTSVLDRVSDEQRDTIMHAYRYVWGRDEEHHPRDLVAKLAAIIAHVVGEEICADGEGAHDTAASLSSLVDALDDLTDAIHYP